MTSRIILPDPPDAANYAADAKAYMLAIQDWMQRVKGNLFTQSLLFSNPATATSVVDTSTIIKVLSDGSESWGSGPYTTDGSGVFAITHGLKATPSFAVVLPLAPGANVWMFNVNTLGSTQLGCTAYSLGFGTPLLASTAISAMFLTRA